MSFIHSQEVVCQALGLPLHKVVVRCRRLGGGFGGKATLSKRTAVAAAVGAVLTGRQVGAGERVGGVGCGVWGVGCGV